MHDVIEAAYAYAFELVGLMRRASILKEHRAFADGSHCDLAADAADELQHELWQKLTGLRPVFEPTDPIRKIAYSGPCKFRLGDWWTAYKAATCGEQHEPIRPVSADGDFWVEATLDTVGHQTHIWLKQMLFCCFVDTTAAVVGTANYSRCASLREICPFTNELDGLLRERLLTEQANLLRHCPETEAPQTITGPTSTAPNEKNKAENLQGDGAGMSAIIGLYTDGLSNKKFEELRDIFESSSSLNEKLEAMDKIMRIPPLSAAKIGAVFGGVTKQAVQNTQWYIKNRKGKSAENIDRRHDVHKERAKQHQADYKDEGFD